MSKLAVNANTLWLYAVLVHIAGSIVVNVMTALPFGSVILMTGIWAGLFLALNKNRKYMIPLGAGWVLSIFILFNIPPSYEGSFLLNGFIVVLVFYVCQSRETDPVEFCHIKKIPVKQWGLIFLLSIGLIIIAGYVNGISMLAFYNGTVNSLQEVGKYFPESLIVLALVPALSEEMLFRGCIYQEISGMDKKGKGAEDTRMAVGPSAPPMIPRDGISQAPAFSGRPCPERPRCGGLPGRFQIRSGRGCCSP